MHIQNREKMVGDSMQIVAAAGAVLTGYYSPFALRKVRGFPDQEMLSGRGLRKCAPSCSPPRMCMLMLGILCLAAAVRVVFMFNDHCLVSPNYIILAEEVVFGLILLL